MSVSVDGYELSVVSGTHRFNGQQGSASIDLTDARVTVANPGDLELLAAAAFHAGRVSKAHDHEVGDIEPNVSVVGVSAAPAFQVLRDGSMSRRE